MDAIDCLKRNMRALGFYSRIGRAARDIASKAVLYRMLWGHDMPEENIRAMVLRDIGEPPERNQK